MSSTSASTSELRPLVAALLLLGAACSSSSVQRRPVRLALEALDGGQTNTSRYVGRAVVLHFFSTSDVESQVDSDILGELFAQGDKRVVIIGVALDRNGKNLIAPWRSAAGVRYLVTLPSRSLVSGSSSLGPISNIPSTIVLDKRGRVHRRIDRPLARGELDKTLREILGKR